MRIYKISSVSKMYHNTSKDNEDFIEWHGLKINQEPSKTKGELVSFYDLYGVIPVFLTTDPNLFKGPRDITFEVDVVGLDLVADIPSLYDLGGYYGDDERGMWFEKGKVPVELIDFADENGMLFYDDLLEPNSSLIYACIQLTKTAACENNIEPERIRKII